MPERALQKLERLLKLQKLMQPKTIYEEMAKEGLLHEYLKMFMSHKISVDEDFRDAMFDLIFIHSESPIEEMDNYVLEILYESLAYFEERTKSCLKHAH